MEAERLRGDSEQVLLTEKRVHDPLERRRGVQTCGGSVDVQFMSVGLLTFLMTPQTQNTEHRTLGHGRVQ